MRTAPADPESAAWSRRASLLLARRSRIHRHRELRDVGAAFQHRDLGRAVLLHFVDAQDRMHGQEGALHAGKFALDALLRGVEDHRGALPEQQLLDLYESEQLSVADFAGSSPRWSSTPRRSAS